MRVYVRARVCNFAGRILQKNQLLAGLSEDAIACFVEYAELRAVGADTVVIQQGDAGHEFFIAETGGFTYSVVRGRCSASFLRMSLTLHASSRRVLLLLRLSNRFFCFLKDVLVCVETMFPPRRFWPSTVRTDPTLISFYPITPTRRPRPRC